MSDAHADIVCAFIIKYRFDVTLHAGGIYSKMMDDEGSYYYLLKGVVIFNQRAVIIINDNFAGKFAI